MSKTIAPEIGKPYELKLELIELLKNQDGNAASQLEENFGGAKGITRRLHTSTKKGILDVSEALYERTRYFGSNNPSGLSKRKNLFHFLVYGMTDVVLIILVTGAIVSDVLGFYYPEICKGKPIKNWQKNAWTEGSGILGTAVVIALLSTLSDYFRDKSFHNLQDRIENERKAVVTRSGKVKKICYRDVKVGDLCLIKRGSIIPADGILVENTEITTDESSVLKATRNTKSNRDPFVYASTHVIEGNGKMIVLAVGDSTQAGRLAQQRKKDNANSSNDNVSDPDDVRQTLQGKLTMASAILGLIGILVGIIVGLVLLVSFCVKTYEIDNIAYDPSHWNEIIKAFIIGIVIIIVAEPEGLSMAVTIILSRSLGSMSAQQIFVRNADVLETMGSVTTICCSKTGVLTAVSEMSIREEVVESYLGGKHFRGDTNYYKSKVSKIMIDEIANGIAINTSYSSTIELSEGQDEPKQIGDITECALLQFATDLGVYYPFIREANPVDEFSKVFPFTPDTKSMTTVVRQDSLYGVYKIYSKGSPDVVLERCTSVLMMDGDEDKLDIDELNQIKDAIDVMQNKSQLKVMCLAYGSRPQTGDGDPPWENENDVAVGLTLVAVVGIKSSLGQRAAGSRVVVTEGRLIGKAPFSGANFSLRVYAKMLHQDLVDDFCRGVAVTTSYLSDIQNEEDDKLPKHIGDPTDCALLQFILELGKTYQYWRDEYPEHRFIYQYSSYPSEPTELQYTATVIRLPDQGIYKVYLTGGAEFLLCRCSHVIQNYPGERQELDQTRKDVAKNVFKKLEDRQLKVVVFAVKEINANSKQDWTQESTVLCGMTLVGYVGLEEKARGQVTDAILTCRRAGMNVTMVTGASLQAAGSFAQHCGILTPNKAWPTGETTVFGYDSKAFERETQDQSGKFSQEKFNKIWPEHLRVLACCSPTSKMTLVQAIRGSCRRQEGEVVAAVASGIHDGPFLRHADVGLTMGSSGSDVAQEASDIVLKGDNFGSVLETIKWGRHIYETVLKYLQFQLTATWVALIVLTIGAIVFQKSIFSAAQLLWLNLIMDVLASLALTGDRPTDDILRHKSYGRDKPLISRAVLRNVIGHAIYQITIIFIMIFLLAEITDTRYGYSATHLCRPTQHSTMVFNTFVLMQLFNEINCRRVTDRNVFYRPGMNFDWVFLLVFLLSLMVQIIIVEYFTNAFRVEPLDAQQWMWCFFFGFSELIWGQIIFSIPKSFVPGELRCCKMGVGPDEKGCCAALSYMRGIRSRRQRKSVLDEFYGAGNHASTRTLTTVHSSNSVMPTGTV